AHLAREARRAEELHEFFGSAAGAEAERHAGLHGVERRARGGGLLFVSGHQYPPAAPPCRGSATATILPRPNSSAFTSPIDSRDATACPIAFSAFTVVLGVSVSSYAI